MRESVSIGTTVHDLYKVNLITKIDRRGRTYDEYQCRVCKAKGKRYGLSSIVELTGKKLEMDKCREQTNNYPKIVKITSNIVVNANNPAFAGLTIGNLHRVIDPPESDAINYPNSRMSVWIMGQGEPVRILSGEFKEFKRQ